MQLLVHTKINCCTHAITLNHCYTCISHYDFVGLPTGPRRPLSFFLAWKPVVPIRLHGTRGIRMWDTWYYTCYKGIYTQN